MGAPYALRATAAPAAPAAAPAAIATPWSLPPPPPADLFDDPRGELSPPLLDGRLACCPPPPRRLVLAITPDSNSLSSFGKGPRVPAARTDASPDAAEVEASVGRRSPLPLRLPLSPPLPGRDPRIFAVAAGSTAVDADPGAALDLDSRTSSSRVPLGAARGACVDLAVMAAAAAVAAAACCADLPDALAAPASSLDRVATAPTPAAAAAAAPAPARALLGGPARLRLPPTLPGDTGPGVDDDAAPGRLAGLAPRPLCLAKTSLSSESVAALAPADPAPPVPAPAPAPPEDDRSATAPGLVEAGRAPLPLRLARTSCSRDDREARAAATAAGLPLPPGPEGLVGALPSTEMAPTALLPEPTAPPPPALSPPPLALLRLILRVCDAYAAAASGEAAAA